MNNILFCLCLLSLFSCDNEQETVDVKKETKDSLTVANSDTIEENDEEVLEEVELNFVVSVAEGYNYDSLHAIAVDASKLLNFKFDTFDRYYDSKRGIILPDNHEDDVWAGQYLLRRSGGEIVSIERSSAYIDTLTMKQQAEAYRSRSNATKMFVFASMYTDSHSADSIKNILVKKYASAKVIPTEIYQGCIH